MPSVKPKVKPKTDSSSAVMTRLVELYTHGQDTQQRLQQAQQIVQSLNTTLVQIDAAMRELMQLEDVTIEQIVEASAEKAE